MAVQNNTPPEQTTAWRLLAEHQRQVAELRLHEEFARDPGRAQRFSLGLEGLFVDFSRNLITDETLSLLLDLAGQRGLDEKIDTLFSGQEVNTTEQRPALHTLLRVPEGEEGEELLLGSCFRRNDNSSVVPAKAGTQRSGDLAGMARRVREERDRMFAFVNRLRAGEIRGSAGKPITRVVNIGIGGSDLGPRLVNGALPGYHREGMDIDFVANIDPFDIERALARADPETTLFIVASKSFTTQETLVNATRAKRWLAENGCNDTGRHFLAVSGNAAAVERFGIGRDRYFKLEDWTGGRYSIWSCVGMSSAISIGEDNFREFLAGAHALDLHFRSSAFDNNIPVILALLSVWYNNFFDIGAHAVIPYDQRLEILPAYLGQLVMESNGKSVGTDGNRVGTNTSQVIWGGTGSQAQHAVFQFLHQGTRMSSIDFLLPLGGAGERAQHELLVANCLAQGEALMRGSANSAEPHRHFDGNRPSTTIVYDRLDPYTLGMLLALYEHKTYVEAAIWGINAFDQWGVELGKTLAGQIAAELAGGGDHEPRDSSTALLMNKYRSGKA